MRIPTGTCVAACISWLAIIPDEAVATVILEPQARAIVWTVAAFYFATTLALSFIACMFVRKRRSQNSYEPRNQFGVTAVKVVQTEAAASNGSNGTRRQREELVASMKDSPAKQKSPYKMNRTESTKPLVVKGRLESESSDGDRQVEGNGSNGTRRQQEGLVASMKDSPAKQKSPNKVNRTDSTKPLVIKGRLESESSDGDRQVEGWTSEHHERHKLNGEGPVFEKDETTATGDDERGIAGPSIEHIEVEERRRSNPRKESAKPLNGTNVSESSNGSNGTRRQQEELVASMKDSPAKQKSPHKVNRTDSTKPLVIKGRLESDSSDGDHQVEGRTAEHHEMEMHGLNGEGPVLDEVFEEDETAATTGDDERDTAGPSTEDIDKKIEKRVEEGKRRRRSNPRKESAKPLNGTNVSESSA